ncbi:membrane-bound PQQ-dependent dehydrogenase, glucose/quinate/shikimate family [Pseudomonas fulva]|nr:membrane-bound PQQ-dependent dehydrogenase, glucose/quinate/shikimate family [Pseudomonas fulva]
MFFPLFGAFVICVALAIGLGGVWLAWLGGSLYYTAASLVSLAAGIQLCRRRASGVWLISGLTILTLVWACWEVGYDGWAMIPRLDWLIVLCLIMLLAWGPVRRQLGISPAAHLAASGIPAVLGVAAIMTPLILPSNVELADPALAAARPTAPFNAPERTPVDSNVASTHDESNWTAYAGSNHSNHFSPAAQITPENVGRLVKAWEFHTGDLPEPGEGIDYLNENTPLKVGDTLYVCTPTQQIIALDATSGQERWRFDPKADRKALKTAGAYCRGVAFYQAPAQTDDCPTRIVWGVTGGRMAAVDARTGQLCQSFGDGGYVDLKKHLGDFTPGYFGNTSAPIVLRDKVIIGHMVRDGQDRLAPSGVVRAFDAVTGKFAWAWDLGRPGQTGEPGPGETYTPGTPNVWAPLAADDRLGLVYLPTGNAAGDFWASTRSAMEEEYTSSLVAVDVDTGQVRWYFRTVNHDLWDFDIGPQPNLIDWPTEQGMKPAVIQATKSGQIFVLNRETGEPLMPVEHLPVPQGADGGNWTAATQPFSTGMPNTVGAPSKSAELLEEADAWGISPFDQLQCRIQFRSLRYDGMFTPPVVGGTLAYPGNHGGINWGGVSVDLDKGIMVMNTNRLPYVERLVPREEIDRAGSRSLTQGGPSKGLMPQVGLPMGAQKAPWLSSLQTPCIAPPWGYLSGVDLRTKEVIWRRPLGSGHDTGPLGIASGVSLQMGTPSDGGPLTTSGGVTFIGAALDYVMRAFDTNSGELLWQTRLPAGPQGSPLTYVQNGKQFVVAVVGGHDRLDTRIGDSVIAWTLPDSNKKGVQP